MKSRSDAAVWVIIAAYNEAATLPVVIAGLTAHDYQILVVDDGST
ncbi:MAG: glycosyltransferase, partial [Isosphaeraceae bacterium]